MLCPSSAKSKVAMLARMRRSQKESYVMLKRYGRTVENGQYAAFHPMAFAACTLGQYAAFHPMAFAACTLGVPFHNNCRRRWEPTQLCCRVVGRFGFDSVKSLGSQPNKEPYCLARCRLVTMVCSHASVLPESSRAADGKDVSQLACE